MTGRFKRYDKLLIVLVLAIACLPPAVALATNIDATQMVPCKVEPSVISVNITSDGDVAYGVLAPGETQDTVTLGDTQTAKNTGDVTVDFEIKSSNAIRGGGTDWGLKSVAGADEFTHDYSTDSGQSWDDMKKADTYYDLAANVPAEGYQDFDLRIGMPTTIADYGEHSVTVTVLATAA